MATKRAVCVGINYPGTENELSGCVNDATDWADLLHGAGYSDVHMLLDGAATKQAIVTRLREVIATMRWGDRLVFTFSGHGTWVPDRDGDEVDGRDEALVPTDFMTGGIITDDELQSIFNSTPAGTGALIISDSCHSGTLSRSFSGYNPGLTDPTEDAYQDPDGNRWGPGKARFLTPAVFLDSMTEERAVDLEARVDTRAPRKAASLISGCADQEYSYDAWFGSRANGAMTRAAIETYTDGISLNNWHKAIRNRLPSSTFPQTPQMTAASSYRKYTRAI